MMFFGYHLDVIVSDVKAKVGEAIRNDAAPKKQERHGEEAILSIPISPTRSRGAFALFVLFTVLVIGRSAYLQIFNNEFLQKKGEERYARIVTVPAQRGQIVDRNGIVLASSSSVRAICAVPNQLAKATREQIATLAEMIQMSPEEILARVEKRKDKYSMDLAHKISVDVAREILALKIPGIYTEVEVLRNYSDGEISAHVVGFTDKDSHGLEGIERVGDSVLAGHYGQRYIIRDRLGRIVDGEWVKEATVGNDIVLSIDSRLQFTAYKALKNAVEQSGAKAGACVVADVRTGEILALNNYPTYDPNNRKYIRLENVRNRALTDQFEPGSTMKPFAVAKALDLGHVTPDTKIDTGPGEFFVADRRITDTHNYGELTVSEVIAKSSNIGTVKISSKIDGEQLWKMYNDLGFGVRPKIDLTGAVSGILRRSDLSRPVEKATISYGYGVSVSLLQLVRAYTALARNGDVIDLTLRKMNREAVGKQVFSAAVARQMRAMLAGTVKEGGTARRVSVKGYTIAGKTGTANKLRNGAYVDKLALGSFVGMAPATQPRLIVAVMIDEPTKGSYFGGTVATPVFNEVTATALQLLGVHPDDSNFVTGARTMVKGLGGR